MIDQELSAGQEYPDGMRDAGKRAIDAMKVERNESNARARVAEARFDDLMQSIARAVVVELRRAKYVQVDPDGGRRARR